MNQFKELTISHLVLKLELPDETQDLKYSSSNNITAYNDKGIVLWNIRQLLKDYSNKNGLKYFDEMYFDIKPINDSKIYCVGINHHCEINLESMTITKIINNR